MKSGKSSPVQFRDALETEAASYGIVFTEAQLGSLSKYYELLELWNSRLHLVAPTSPKAFATRHVLESLLLLNHLRADARVADVGSGAGLPIIPCLIMRPDLSAILIEASRKKTIFLREALNAIAISRAIVIAERFETIDPPDVGYVTSRALERFEQMLPQLISWAPRPGEFLLFGGEGLAQKIAESGLSCKQELIPKSQRRFLFVISNP